MTTDPTLLDAENVDLGELTTSIGFLLRLAQVRVFDAFYERLETLGLKPGEFTVLWVIGLNPGLRQGAVARRLAIKPAHMTKLVQRMVHAGLVRRVIPRDDRRSVRLSLTGKGQAFVAAHKDAFLGFHRAERGKLTDDDCARLGRLLRKFNGITEPAHEH